MGLFMTLAIFTFVSCETNELEKKTSFNDPITRSVESGEYTGTLHVVKMSLTNDPSQNDFDGVIINITNNGNGTCDITMDLPQLGRMPGDAHIKMQNISLSEDGTVSGTQVYKCSGCDGEHAGSGDLGFWVRIEDPNSTFGGTNITYSDITVSGTIGGTIKFKARNTEVTDIDAEVDFIFN